MFPKSLSPSRASDFVQCPLLYRLRTIDQVPETPSSAAIRGTLVHSVLENIFDLPAGHRTVRMARSLFKDEVTRMATERPIELEVLLGNKVEQTSMDEYTDRALESVTPLLETYFAMEDPNRLEPHAREMALSVDIDEGFAIRGFIDRVDKNPDGDIRVVDYKTGKSPGERYAEKAMFQMRFYALAWWRLTETIPRMLQLIYLGDGRFLRYQPEAADLLATEKRILAIRSAISRSAENGLFPPAPGKLCSWCSFKPICPAHGGTPPLLPDIETWSSGSSLVEEALRQVTSPESE